MSFQDKRGRGWLKRGLVGLATAMLSLPVCATVLDNFNGATKTGWEDTNPAKLPLPPAAQANGQFTFVMPALGQSYFMSSTKKSDTFELKEGRALEFRADMVHGHGVDSFAVLGWIPTATGANTLAGYGIAKSESDILITKGINKYFYNETPAVPIKNDNITLVLNIKALGGNVYITGQVLDKDDHDRVIWEKSFVDTPGADVLSDGQDSPPAPFITTGNAVLYLYAAGGTNLEGYTVTYDNLEYFVTDDAVIDDFNGATKTGWEDTNPAKLPLPPSAQANGQLTFVMPALGQPYFESSTKKTSTFELKEGERTEFSVDLLHGQGPDSFAVLSWIPTATGANTLAGYGLAKSETDMLIIKGIGKYFYSENPTIPIKNENVTLSIQLTVHNGNVIIRGRVLDKDNNNAVLFDQTYIDTPAADVLSDGQDNPSAPFITSGNVVLYLYADGGTDPAGYTVVYDNLRVSAPPAAANQPPVISAVTPDNGAEFLSASTKLTFLATDDKPLPDSAFSITLNGVVYTTANGVTLGGTTAARTVSLGGLVANTVYAGEIKVTDADGVARTQAVWFDTLADSNFFVEVEDYNFENGGYFTNPERTPEGWGSADNSYTDRVGTEGVDFHETRTSPRAQDTMYRTQDSIRMAHSLDLQRSKFDNSVTFDYDVGDIDVNEWMNYTRDFAAGSYEVYLREAVINFPQADSVLELITGDTSTTNQTAKVLGTFLGKTTGYTFRSFPLTDGTGLNKVILRLSGKTTLRLRQLIADGNGSNRLLNYLVFLPVADPGVQRATVSSAIPADGSTIESVAPKIQVVIQNRDTTVNKSTVALKVGGQTVTPTVTTTADGATVSYSLSPLPASGSVIPVSISFKDNLGVEVSASWSFTLTYKTLDAANARSGPGLVRGLVARLVQAPAGSGLENSLQRAEDQLKSNSQYPIGFELTFDADLVNYNKRDGEIGIFPNDVLLPLDGSNGDEDFAVEFVTYLDLTAGVHRFGAVTDDGYKISSGSSLHDLSVQPLGFHNGGTANETFDFVAPVAGFYPFRMLWYERGGAGGAEWFSEDLTTGDRILINDASNSKAVKAYRTVTSAPTLSLESTAAIGEAFTAVTGATIDTAAKRITIAAPTSGNRFFRIKAGSAVTISGIQVSGANLVIQYQ